MWIKTDYRNNAHPFWIDKNPFNGRDDSIPAWLKSWRFQNEEEAGLVCLLWLNYVKSQGEVRQGDFQNLVVKGTFRIMQVTSVWAE
jgi:hypothetical protein